MKLYKLLLKFIKVIWKLWLIEKRLESIAVGQKKRSSGNYSSSKLAFVTGIRAPEATVKNFCRRVRK
jgi:hypothetical protein